MRLLEDGQGAETPDWEKTREAVLDRSGKHTTLQRPVQHLYPLGITHSESHNESKTTDSGQECEWKDMKANP